MAPPLEEDFSDVNEFVQEDDEPAASEDEVERKIAEEHAKYKEAQARRQEEVRANRPWSAPPVDSPRPEQQKEREKERQARGSISDATALGAPRAEYEPPVRPYLLQAQGSGSNLSYLSRPQSAEPRTGSRLLNGRNSRPSLSGIEEETGEGTASNSGRPSDVGRLSSMFGEGQSGSWAGQHGLAAEVAPLKLGQGGIGQGGLGEATEEERLNPPEPSAEEVAEDSRGPAAGEDYEQEYQGADGDGDGVAGAARVGGAVLDHLTGDDGVLVASAVGLPQQQQQLEEQQQPRASRQRSSSGGGGGGMGRGERPVADQAEEEEQAEEEQAEEEEQAAVDAAWWRADDARSGTHGSHHSGGGAGGSRYGSKSGAPSVAPSATTPRSMAMRGFVEPLPYETSYDARSTGGGHGGEAGDAARASARGRGDDREEDEYEDDYEDSFEDDEMDEEEEGASGDLSHVEASAEPSSVLGRTSNPASLRRALSSGSRPSSARGAPSREHSRAMSPPPPPSYPATPGGDDDDRPPQLSMVDSLLPPLKPIRTDLGEGLEASPASRRSLSSCGGDGVAAIASGARSPALSLQQQLQAQPQQSPAVAAAESDLLPPQQFALQLLRHDIDVLPQHHRAAAEAAAARRKSAGARPVGATLAAFGYLGYHLVPEDLTAPAGPGFRPVSPGRSSSPGRADGSFGGGLLASTSMKAVRPAALEEPGPGAGRVGSGGGGRPTSAPHMRPSSTAARTGGGGRRGDAVGEAQQKRGLEDGEEDVALPAAAFIGTAREMREARLLPPVGPRRLRSSSGGSGLTAAPTGDGASLPTDRSLSVLDEHEASTAQNRIKFDVWKDSWGGKGTSAVGGQRPGAKGIGASDAPPSSDTAAAAGPSRRQPRPMTAPATGRRRPISARPVGSTGLYGMPPPATRVPKPLARPLSAQPHYLRPSSATHGCGGGGRASAPPPDAAADPSGPPPTATVLEGASAAGGTAAVEIAGVTVSVYVADTLKRIVEANRWLQQLGVTAKRYRLKDRHSSMMVQLCEELPAEDPYENDGPVAMAVVKELTLKQFLSGHAKLKQQVRRLRQQQQQLLAGAPPLPPAAGPLMSYGYTDLGGGGGGAAAARAHQRPFSATLGSTGSAPASRGRPVSAAFHSSVRSTTTSAGGADPGLYGGAGGHSGGYAPGHPARPSSANPAYGRTPNFNMNAAGSSPPGASMGAFTPYGNGVGGVRPASASPGLLAAPRAAWGAATGGVTAGGSGGGGFPHHQQYTFTSTGGSEPYMYRSVSATARAQSAIDRDVLGDDDDDGEPALVVEPDEHGDISRAVRQQLGGAADYCQVRRHEIARLRNMPLA